MIITVKYNHIEIIVDEENNKQTDRMTTIKFKDQQEYVKDTISLMCEEIRKFNETK